VEKIVKVPVTKNKVVLKKAATVTEVVPVVVEEEKEVTTKDITTGEEKKEIVKMPVTKNKVIRKPAAAAPVPVVTPAAISAPAAAPVAQNSTHEVVPVVEEEEKEVTTKDTATGEEKKEIVKVPVTKNKVVPKKVATIAPAAEPVEVPAAAAPVA